MVDVHCHLNFNTFDKDYDEVIGKAFEAGVTKIINVGTKIDSSQKAVELANKYENLYAIVGIHPHHADKPLLGCHPELLPAIPILSGRQVQAGVSGSSDWLTHLEKLVQSPKVVAIGEIGIDYYSYKSNTIVNPKLQKEVFIKQIELAYNFKLPLQIHNRHAGKDIIDILINHKSYLINPPGMFHCMSGDIDLLREVIGLGFYVGFDGNITYRGKAIGETTDLKDLVNFAPLDRIVVETDSPFLAPEPYRGSRNIPSYVIIVGKSIAEIKAVSFDKVLEQTTKNAIKLFKLKNKF